MKTMFALNYFGTLMATVIALLALAAHAGPGDYDASFAGNSRVISRVNSSSTDEILTDAVMQPDGKLVSVGHCAISSSATRFCAMRHTNAGVLDNTFGELNSGTTSILISTDFNYATGVALQRDGKIVLAGYCGRSGAVTTSDSFDVCLARLLPNGRLDTTFGAFGLVRRVVLGSDEIVNAVVVDGDGVITVGGSTTGATFASTVGLVVSFSPSGALLPGFQTPGSATSGNVEITALALEPFVDTFGLGATDALWYAGTLASGANTDFLLGGGIYTVLSTVALGTGNDYARKTLRLPNNYAVVLGNCDVGTKFGFCAARFSAVPDSSLFPLDPTFGIGGKVLLAPFNGSDSIAYSGLAQPDGKLVLAGECKDVNAESRFCLARVNTDGSVDKTFGLGSLGYAIDVAAAGGAGGRKVMMQPDGKLVVAGVCVDSAGRKSFCLSRYQGGPFAGRYCSLDIDGDGRVLGTTDMLIFSRVAAGMTGEQVLNGINLTGKPRSTWKDIREYLIGQCGLSIAR